jgi:hypothetical protein
MGKSRIIGGKMRKETIQLFNDIDLAGNKLSCNGEGQLFLKLVSNGKKRYIGKITDENGTLHYIKQVKKEHRFHKTNSWGLCHRLISKLIADDMIHIYESDTRRRYTITVADAKKYGSFLYFKTSGFERQIFIPLRYWKIITY